MTNVEKDPEFVEQKKIADKIKERRKPAYDDERMNDKEAPKEDGK